MGADQVAAIQPAIVELEDAARGNEPEYVASFTVPGRDQIWVEVVLGTVNLAYPFHDPPEQRLRASRVVELAGVTLQEWQPGVFATFAYDPSTPSRQVAKFIDQVLGTVLGCGEDYPIDVGIVRLDQG
jgi:hypothetical protein